MNRIGLLTLVGLLVACSGHSPKPTLEPQGAFDVAVGEMHVTQGVQHYDQHFWAPLVAERNTAVRVQVERVSGIPGPITGKLHVFVNGQEVTPSAGVDALNNGFVPPANDTLNRLLANEQDTLNFELLAAAVPLTLPAGVNETNDVDFVVEIFGDSDASNNAAQVDDLTLVRRYSPTVIHFRLLWDEDSAGLNQLYGEPQPMDDRKLKAVWPIPDVYVQPPVPGFVPPEWDPSFSPYRLRAHLLPDCNGDGKITRDPSGNRDNDPKCLFNGVESTEYEVLFARMLIWRYGIMQAGWGPDAYTYVYGWVKDGGLDDHDGLTQQLPDGNGNGFGVVGYGVDRPVEAQKVFAHEFGHMMGLGHNDRSVHEYGWDTGARLHNHPLPMRDGGRVKAVADGLSNPGYDDIMSESGEAVTVSTWIDLQSYQAVLNSPRLSAATTRSPCAEDPGELETLVVYGVPGQVEKQTNMSVQVFTYPWCIAPNDVPKTPNLIITLEVEAPSGKRAVLEVPVDARMKAKARS